MARSIFGWDLPPGCTSSDIDRQAGVDAPCELCGRDPSDPSSDGCDCPECPVCGVTGDPSCVTQHDLASRCDVPARRRAQEQLDTTLGLAIAAFWAVVASAYPDVKTGDLSPRESVDFEMTSLKAVTAWLRNNRSA